MSYELGFSEGERAAFRDRRDGVARAMPAMHDEYRRGYMDGYTPRSVTWALRDNAPPKAWWVEREAMA